jgi:GNAT superfamily N-acetyltransferase
MTEEPEESEEEEKEREYSDLTEDVYAVFNEFTEQLGFISKVQVEQAEEADQLYWKESEDGEIVAAAIIRHCVNKPQTTLQDIAVLEEHRGKGLAQSIIDEAAEDSRHPKMLAKCPVDLPSNDWYDSQGWEHAGVQDGKNRDLNIWELELIETEDALEW